MSLLMMSIHQTFICYQWGKTQGRVRLLGMSLFISDRGSLAFPDLRYSPMTLSTGPPGPHGPPGPPGAPGSQVKTQPFLV